MEGYTEGQIRLLQKICDIYICRGPAGLGENGMFFEFPGGYIESEPGIRKDVVYLKDEGLLEERMPQDGSGTCQYRFTQKALPIIGKLERDRKISFGSEA